MGSVAIAAEQTAGRGQWGRQWLSSVGGLYLSWALAPHLPVANSAQLTLCSAWGIVRALRDRHIPVQIKWPNDLILAGHKLGGILTETRVQQGVITKAAIGVGINWANPVPDTGINLQTFLADRPTPVFPTLESLAVVVLTGLLTGYQQFQQQGIEALLPNYLELLDSLGHPVSIAGDPGVVVGITPTNELRVQLQRDRSNSSSEICLKPGTISLGYRNKNE